MALDESQHNEKLFPSSAKYTPREGIASMADQTKFLCRMYENEFPKVDDLVMVNVRQIADMGAYVKLVSLFVS